MLDWGRGLGYGRFHAVESARFSPITPAKEGSDFMSTIERSTEMIPLNLPEEFNDLEGLIGADLQAVVVMLVQRAHERLYLTGRQHRQLQTDLWNGLVDAVNSAAAPLSIENR